jgi:hypothetical protein
VAIEDWHQSQPEADQPLYSQSPPDPELQTGASQLLGGEQRLRAPWLND